MTSSSTLSSSTGLNRQNWGRRRCPKSCGTRDSWSPAWKTYIQKIVRDLGNEGP